MVIQASLDETGQVLRALRAQANMTLQKASDATGLSVSFISDMERGRTDPSLSTLRKLSEAYQCTVSFVFTSTT